MTRPILVISANDTDYVRTVVQELCILGMPPTKVLLGSRAERIFFKLNSLTRIARQLGFVEVLKRIRRARSRDQRSGVPTCDPIETLAARHGFAMHQYALGNSGDLILELLKHRNAVLVLAGCGIVESSVIQAASGGVLNGHPAFLPGLRGVDVVQWALVEEKPIGVTAHYVTPLVDAGEIIEARPVATRCEESWGDFQARIVIEQARLLAEATVRHCKGQVLARPNDISQSQLKLSAPDQIWSEAARRFEALRQKAS